MNRETTTTPTLRHTPLTNLDYLITTMNLVVLISRHITTPKPPTLLPLLLLQDTRGREVVPEEAQSSSPAQAQQESYNKVLHKPSIGLRNIRDRVKSNDRLFRPSSLNSLNLRLRLHFFLILHRRHSLLFLIRLRLLLMRMRINLLRVHPIVVVCPAPLPRPKLRLRLRFR